MFDLPQTATPVAETILVQGRAITPAAGAEAFGRIHLDEVALEPASGRVEDALRGIGGVQLFRASSTRTSNPTADGITARGLSGNAASRLQVTLDGAPLADPFFGFVSWGQLVGRKLASAELVRGGGLGGSGALAGTLELTSAVPDTEASLRGGSRAGLDTSASLALPGGGFGLFGGYSRGDGHMLVAHPGPADVPAAYRQWSAGARAGGEVGGMRLSASLSGFDDRRLRGVEGADIRSSGGDANLRLEMQDGWRTQALAFLQLRDFSTVNRTLDASRSVATTSLDQQKTPASGWGLRLAAEPPLGDNLALNIAAEWRAADGKTLELFRYAAGLPTRQRRAGGSQQVGGLAANGTARLSDALLLTGAFRVDRWRLGTGTLQEIDLATGLPVLDESSDARTGTEWSGRAGALWRPFAAVRVRAAAYHGWRLPTLNELHRPFRAGADATAANPSLEPERLDGVEASIGWQPVAAFDAGLTLFANRLKNPIANVTLAQGPGVFPGVGFVAAGGRYRQRQNLQEIRSRGLEGDASVAAGSWRLQGSFAWVDAEMRGGGLDGKRPAQAPEFSGSMTLGRSGGAVDGSATLRVLGARFEDDLNDRRLAPATTLDLKLSVPVTKRLRLEAAAENLFDADVESGFSGAQVELGQPRTLWLGIRVGGS
ncbi:TonB-dependent receptor [Sandaracinobacteroides hominis]|uniref:TonB-dependent receptor n=1 Tax=Sandaracinobacteroides hominis TaxID=2780086 RepID=UPI0018F546F2|nr:TonB-dependent receptor [Sandaracinobacteroides hominis]